MSNPYVHSIFKLLLIKQIFGKKNHQGQRLKAGCSFGLELSLITFPLLNFKQSLSKIFDLLHKGFESKLGANKNWGI